MQGGGGLREAIVFWGGVVSLVLAGGMACTSTNPAAPPSPLAEIPSFLVIPSSINIEESGNSSEAASPFLFQTTERPLEQEIPVGLIAVGGIIELFNSVLGPFQESLIPVDPTVTKFRQDLPFQFETFDFQFDFRPFDFDGDGAPEACSGTTCPLASALNLAACPSEAPEDQLLPICFRIWVNGRQFMAGLFDRVPTAENKESGTFRVLFPPPTDLPGTRMSVKYNLASPEDQFIDLSGFNADPDDVGPDEAGTEFFQRNRGLLAVEGPANSQRVTARVSTEFIGAPIPSMLRSQSESFLDFMALELIATGVFADGSFLEVLEDVTPPLCAQLSSAMPVPDILCEDLGLELTLGDFPPFPEIEEVTLPADFPTSPIP